MTVILVFENKAKADTLIKEIAVTPFGSVWVWFNPESEANDIQYATNEVDERYAVCHNFSEEDADWLEAYLQGVAGVEILDALPDNWYAQPVFPEVIVTE